MTTTNHENETTGMVIPAPAAVVAVVSTTTSMVGDVDVVVNVIPAAVPVDVLTLVDHMTEPATTATAIVSSSSSSKQHQSLLLGTQIPHHCNNKQRTILRASILLPAFISLLIVATIGHLYKSTTTLDTQFDTTLSRKVSIGDNNDIDDDDDERSTVRHWSIGEYVIRQFPLLPNATKQEQKRIEALQKNLYFAYGNVTVMLDRSHRFPSMPQRVKLYMSNWYIPPCDASAQITYQYRSSNSRSSSSDHLDNMVSQPPPLLSVHEISMPVLVDDNDNVQPHKKLIRHNLQQPQPLPPPQRVFVIDSHFDGTHDTGTSFDEVHYMDRRYFEQNCTHKYCQDMVEFFLPALDRVQRQRQPTEPSLNRNGNDLDTIPILYQFGDMHQTRATQQIHEQNQTYAKHVRYPNVPVIQKVRMSQSPLTLFRITDESKFPCYHEHERRASVTTTTSATTLIESSWPNHKNHNNIPYSRRAHYDPIVFKLKTHRHYGGIYKVVDADTVPWDSKKNLAIFRGALTGLYPDHLKPGDVKHLTVEERCRLLPRCWFTLTHGMSAIVDSKLTEPYAESKQIPQVMTMPSSQLSIELYGSRMTMNELLEYKALILIEGNDVSSGLKWALFSNSIVMMPPPTLTSWAMEEMLQPWVHYVPIEIYATANSTHALTDAEEKMQWILDHDDQAREIVRASTLWIADLVLHPHVPDEEAAIFDEIARRYLSHFG